MRHALALCAAMTLAVPAHAKTCQASWYGGGEALSSHTASGERFRPEDMTAAHPSLPFGTLVKVSALGRSVVVRINDRGPAPSTGRCIDISKAAARALGMLSAGTAPVRITILN